MSKAEWGVKRLCQSCGTKFYDLQRAPITCPSCGTEADRESPLKSRRARSTAAAPKPVPVAPVKKPPPVEADAGDDAGGDAGGDTGGDASGDASGDEVEDTDLGEDTADDSDDDLVEDTSELGDDDLSDVVVSKDDDDQR